MHLSSVFALASLAAAAPSALTARQSDSVDISGSYWDATIKYQSGRPGFIIRDLSVNFHNPKFEQAAVGSCHYSFVPQGTSPPAVTDTCSEGLKYTWSNDAQRTLALTQKITVAGEILTLYGSAQITNYTCRGDGVGSGSTCEGSGRVELDHYCKLDGDVPGCYSPGGNA